MPDTYGFAHGIGKKEMLSYLEKQKDEAQRQYNLGVQAGREEVMYELEKEQKIGEYPLCETIKDKIKCYIANHFIADREVTTDIPSIVHAMEEGVRLGKEEEQKEKKPVEPTCKTCVFYENDCPFTRGKFMPYPNKVCKDYTYSDMKVQHSKPFSCGHENGGDSEKQEQPSLPYNLDEAAEKYGRENIILPEYYNDGDIDFYAEETGKVFKAGAEWMAGQMNQLKLKL